MKLPRLLIPLLPAALAATVLTGCGDGLALEAPTPSVTRPPVLAPTAPAVPTTARATEAAVAEATATEVLSTTTPTEAPPGNLEPVTAPTQPPPEPTEAPAESPPAVTIDFAPGELVQGGAVIAYFNAPATAATMTFGGKQYPMLFDGARWWAMLGIGAFAEAGSAPVTVAYNPADGSPQAEAASSIQIVDREYNVENIELDEETSALLDPSIVNNEEALRATIFSGYTTQRLWEGQFLPPANSAITSSYGIARSYNSGPVTSYHRGTDFLGTDGDPAYAAAAGRVVFAEELQVRGNSVIIDHGVGVYTTYSHLSQIGVSEGEVVKAGQQIGQIGSTGLVTGPHLHWEVVVRGIEVDGELWLSGVVAP